MHFPGEKRRGISRLDAERHLDRWIGSLIGNAEKKEEWRRQAAERTRSTEGDGALTEKSRKNILQRARIKTECEKRYFREGSRN